MNVVTRHADRLLVDAYFDQRKLADTPSIADAVRAVAAIVGAAAEIGECLALGPLAVDAGVASLSGALHEKANRIMASALQSAGVAAVNFDELAVLDAKGCVAVAIDPLHGSINTEFNGPAGTLFSVLPCTSADKPGAGHTQIAAGMIVYGAPTVMALSFGDGVHRFVLDPKCRGFVRALTRPDIPRDARDYALDVSKRRHWDGWLRRYAKDCEQGGLGPRHRNFNLRWSGSLVDEAWRILDRGGVWICSADRRPGYGEGAIRLCHEANPIAFLVEQAGGAATNGTRRILEIAPASPHQTIPFVFGSKREVEYVAMCQRNAERSHAHPLFAIKGLFRP